MIKKFYMTSFLFFLVIIGCKHSDSNDIANHITFEIDSSKIQKAKVYDNLGIIFHPPINLIKLNKELINHITKLQTKQTLIKSDTLIVEEIFYDSLTHFQTIISSIKTKDNIITFFFKIDSVLRNNKNLKVLRGNYENNNINFYQLLVTNDEIVNYKLFAVPKKETILIIDYICPRKSYNNEIAKAVESSIGTIKLITKSTKNI